MNIRRSFLALVAMILGVGFFSAPAMAQGCGGGPINVAGDYVVTHTGDCVLDGITAGGRVSVTATGSITINGAISSGGDVFLEAQGGNAQSGAITSGNSGGIAIYSTGAVSTSNLTSESDVTLLYGTSLTVSGPVSAEHGVLAQGFGSINIAGAITSTGNFDVTLDAASGTGSTITLGSSVSAGSVSMLAPGNIQVSGTIDSTVVGSHVDIKTTASGGSVKLDGKITAPGQKVQLVAFGNISTKTIDTTSTSSGSGDVRIIANKTASGAIPVFVIGGSANLNGVNGSIIANTQNAGGQSPYTTSHNVAIVNGGATATGGITVVNGSYISVAATTSKAGCILLDARNGPFTLQAGTLSANGATGQSAGCIAIAADTITVGSNGAMSANDDGTKGYNHYVAVAARQVGVTGTVNLQADGKGVNTGFPGSVLVLAEGSLSWTVPEEYLSAISSPVRTSVATALTVNGTGSLVLRANGAINKVEVVAKPITFSNTGTLTITANGSSQNTVRINNPGSNSGVAGLSFTGGNVEVRSDGVSGVGDASGGYIEIFGDQMTLDANNHTFSANGPSSGNGNGGRFYLSSTAATLKSTGSATVTANAASAGTGNAILGDITTGDPKAIQFFPGSVSIKVGVTPAAGQYSFAAKGGGNGGNGGTVYMSASSMALLTVDAIDASAITTGSANGDGGEIYLNNYITVDPLARVKAVGKGSGKGGKFTAFHFNPGVPLDVNRLVNVDGGDSLLGAPENDFGRVTFNNRVCQQRTTGQSSWPKAYWNCVTPNGSLARQKIPSIMAMGIPNASTRTLLGNALTHMHVHSSTTAHSEFLQDSTPAASTGYTFRDPANAGIPIISSVFESCSNCAGHAGLYTVTDQELKEFSAHELGHAVDFALGSESLTPTYSGYVRRDNANLDYVVIGASEASSVRRLPCAPTPNPAGGNYPDLPPFVGVMAFPQPHQPAVQMCVGTTLNGALGAIPPGTRNSSILTNFSYGHTTVREEVFTQTFAFKAAANAANYSDPSADGVFARSYLAGKPYFACSVGRATQLVTGAGSIPAECTVAVPAWYLVP